MFLLIIERAVEDIVATNADEPVDALSAAKYLLPHDASRWLGNFALVCRAWYARAAPFLNASLNVNDANVDGIRASIRGQTRRSVKIVKVGGRQPFISSARVAKGLSDALWLEWRCPDDRLKPHGRDSDRDAPFPVYHPSLARLLTQSHSAYANVIRLHLVDCCFLSPVDILHLLAAFPSLVHVSLHDISLVDVPVLRAFPRPHTSRLRTIEWCTEMTRRPPAQRLLAQAAFLVNVFQWRQLPSDHLTHGFSGLSCHDAQVVLRIYDLTAPNIGISVQFYLEPVGQSGQECELRSHGMM